MTSLTNYCSTSRAHGPARRFCLLLGAALLLAGTAARAQVGLRVGGGWMTQVKAPGDRVLGAGSVETRSQAGYQVGVFYALPLTKRLSLVPEVQFSRERERVTTSSGSPVSDTYWSDYHLRLSYLNLPVLAHLALGRVYLEAGPQLSWLVGGRGDGTTAVYAKAGPNVRSLPIDQAATDRYRRLDVGLNLGVGVKLLAGVGLNLRAYQGFVQLNREYTTSGPADIPYTANREYRQTLQAALTYQLSTRP